MNWNCRDKVLENVTEEIIGSYITETVEGRFYEKQWNCRGDNRKYTETALQRRDIGKYTGTCLEELLGNLLKTYKRDFGKCTETVERN